MTTIAVFADPPRPGSVLSALVDDGPLDGAEAADLYAALLQDACLAVERSGGDLLVNYRVPEDEDDADARTAVEEAVAPALKAPDAARYEVQVGSTHAARVGNTVTHLLEEEGVRSVAALDPRVAALERRHVDGAAMKLRQSEVVLGQSTGGRVWYAGFTDPVDFTDAFDAPALRTLTERALSADAGVDFTESLPVVRTPADLASAVVTLRAFERADKPVSPHTTARVADLGLDVTATGETLSVVRD